MPRERIQHGKMYVDEPDIEPTEAIDGNSGQPAGVFAHVVREFIPGETLPPGTIVREHPSLDVTWNREVGYVQVSIEAPVDWWDRFHESRTRDEQSHYAAYTEVMDRREINHMIRTLRRARDAAYGADE